MSGPATALDALGALEALWPSCLIHKADTERIRGHLEALPPYFDWLVLETRLGDQPHQVDMMSCVRRTPAAQAMIAQYGIGHFEPHPHLFRVLRDWAQVESSRLEQMPLLWLEYDLPPERWREVAPIIWFRLQDMDAKRSAERQWSLMDRAFEVAGVPLSGINQQRMMDMMKVLPWGAIDVGSLGPRGRPTVKVESRCHLDALPTYLKLLGWSGSQATLERLLAVAGEGWEDIGFQLEVGEELLPHIAVELPTSEVSSVVSQAFSERLGCCPGIQAECVQAVLEWPGWEVHPGAEGCWPVSVQRSSYIKLVQEEGQGLKAKGYLTAFPRWSLLRGQA